MAMTGVNNDTSYTNYYTGTKQTRRSENAANSTEQQAAGKTYHNARAYRNALTEKYDCLKNPDYSVAINSSLLSKASGDEKTAKWLEYNLSLIPDIVNNMKSAAAACGSKMISCNISFNGYDDITTEMAGRFEADPGTEKAREELKERMKKLREEKREEERKTEEKAAEEKMLEKQMYGSDMALIGHAIKVHGFDQKI